MKKYFTIISVALLCACSSETKRQTVEKITDQAVQVAEAIKKIEILSGFEVFVNGFELSGDEPGSFTTKKGSRIHVPAKAFRHKDGKPAEGKVVINFKEYHTPGEVMASGIPMVYETPSGEKQQFESAGMFEIRAFQGNEELELADGKKIEIDLVTNNPGKFNFYAFEEDKFNWNILDTDCTPIKDPEIVKQAEMIEQIKKNPAPKPKKPIEYNPSDKLFDIFVNLQKHPEFAPINGVMWKYTGTDEKSDPGRNPSVFQKKYELISMLPIEGENLMYDLSFIREKDTFKIQAAPVFQGALMTKKSKEFTSMMTAFNEQLIAVEKLKKQEKRETELLRQFAIDKMGIYNYDRQFKDENAIPMLASFDFGGALKAEDLEFVSVFLVPSKKNVVIKYNSYSFEKFALNPKENNRIIAVLPDNSVFLLSDKDIRAMHIDPSKSGKKIVFKMQPYQNKATTPQQLDKILASL